MRFACLGSGSKGNATLVQCQQTTVLLDCGFSFRELQKRLSECELSADDLDAVLITHEHSDHSRGIEVLLRQTDVRVFTSRGTARALGLDDNVVNYIDPGRHFSIGALSIHPVTVPHDAKEPCQFLFRNTASCLGILTDVGSITPHIQSAYADCDSLLLEFNYDADMLYAGTYPASLKRRIASNIGHLGNHQSIGFLRGLLPGRLRQVVAGHLSESNNTPEQVAREASQLQSLGDFTFHIASQHKASDWYHLEEL